RLPPPSPFPYTTLFRSIECAGVVSGLSDVQADDDRESRVHDAVLPWSIIAGRSLDTRCRHPRYEETSDKLGRVPISGQRVSLDRAATPPGPLMAGQQSHTRPSDQTPGHRGCSQGNGQTRAGQSTRLWRKTSDTGTVPR